MASVKYFYGLETKDARKALLHIAQQSTRPVALSVGTVRTAHLMRSTAYYLKPIMHKNGLTPISVGNSLKVPSVCAKYPKDRTRE